MSTAIEERTRNAAGRYEACADKAQAIIEDLEELLSWGESPEQAARRLGYTKTDSLARYLHRQGRKDLANLYWQLTWKHRRYRRANRAPAQPA